MSDSHFGGYPYSPNKCCERHSVGRTATTDTVLRHLLQWPLLSSKRVTTQPSAYDAPSQCWGQRGVLAKPAQVQLYVRATLTQVWGLPAPMRVRLRTSKCHKSWLSKADFTWIVVTSHKVCLCFTLCSQLTHSSHMTRTCVSSLCYNWLMFLWLTIVSHNDVMTFARDSLYESRVPRRWRALRTWYVLCFMIGLRHVAQWLIGVIWWISGMTHYES